MKSADIFAVLVLYNTNLENCLTFQTLTAALASEGLVMEILIYDNSPHQQQVKQYNNWQISYIHDSSNPGVSKAYNTGCKIAAVKNKLWVFLLDQDTFFPDIAIKTINCYLNKIKGIDLFCPILKDDFGFISPSIMFFNRGFAPNIVTPGLNSFKGKSPINSGLIISVKLFESVGGYNEKIKLDFSDFYFINKVSKKVSSFYVMNLVCYHYLSNAVRKELTLGTLYRYQTYCEGAKLSAENVLDYLKFFVITLQQAIKLSIRYKSKVFYRIFISSFLNFAEAKL